MRILEIETFGRGGLIHYAYNLSRALADRGHQVTLVTTVDYELDSTTLSADQIEIVKRIGRFTARSRRVLSGILLRLALQAGAILDAFAVARLARRLRPDVIHLHCTNPAAAVYLFALRWTGRPVVYTAHVVTPHEPFPLQRAIYRRMLRWCPLVVAHSKVDRARLIDELDLPAERITIIPHGEYGFFEDAGTDTAPDRRAVREELGLDTDAEVALFFGYIREYKGLDVLLDIWPAVVRARPAARLVIAGDPVQLPSERRLDIEARASNVGAVCRFEYVPFGDVARYFKAADVLVMPYRRISQSGVLFVALSLGVPVVATAVGALPEVLEDGDSALLVEPESSLALADALVRVLGDGALRTHLSAGGRRVAHAHSWPSIAETTERAFLQVSTRG